MINLLYLTPLLIILSCYFYDLISFSKISRNIFHNYISLISLNTDWKNSFLEFLSEETRRYFVASFISITKIKSTHTGRVIISSGDSTAGFLIENIEKEEYYLQKRKSIIYPFVYETEDVLIKKNQKNSNILKSYNLNHSFMIPVFFSDRKEEVLISVYFRNRLLCFLAYLKYLIVRKKFSYFYASVFRNFIRAFDSSAEMLLEEIEDYVAISLNEKEEIVAWNKGAEKLFGYRSVEIIGNNFVVLFNYGEEETFGKSVEILNIKNNVKYFATLKDKLNIPIKVELKIKKMLTVTSELAGYSIFVRDITKEEIFKENIEQHSFINYTILENSHDGILILDSEDKIIFYNQRVRTILDNSMNLFGIPGKKIFPRRFGEEFEQTIDKLKETRSEFLDIDYCFESKYYNIRFFRVHKNSKNDYGGVIVFFIDESVRMLTMLELEDKKGTLERINNNLLEALYSARIMQENLVPKQLIQQDGICTEAIYKLSDDLGGDFYYSENLVIKGKKYNISFISDVSGHGISSSMMNVMVKDVYGTFVDHVREGSEKIEPLTFLQLLNKKILDLRIEENKFITCVVLIIDFEERLIKTCSAGHTLPYYIRGGDVRLLNFKRAVPLGVIDTIVCDTEQILYQNGDKIILYTDGFLDLFDVDDQKPSDSALFYLEKNKDLAIQQLKTQILERYQLYKEEHLSYTDDLTLLIIEFLE
ncbi:MAG: SpoIIE family protein phosphatase [Brevinema sp.]